MKKAILSAVLVLAATGAGTAMAEGGWSSSLGSVQTGFDSRQWTDANKDANSTKVSATGCKRDNGASTSAEVETRKVKGWGQPDDYLGNRSICGGSVGSWGRLSSGNYRWRVKKIAGSTGAPYLTLSASSVTTTY